MTEGYRASGRLRVILDLYGLQKDSIFRYIFHLYARRKHVVHGIAC